MKINNVPPSLLEQLIRDIKSLVPVHSVYGIASTREKASSVYLLDSEEVQNDSFFYQLTLLLITYDKVLDHRALSQQLLEKSNGRIRTHLILYTYEEIYNQLELGDNFLSRVLRPENCLFQESSLSVSNYMAFPAMYEKIEKGWITRVNRATYFESIADILDVQRDEVARMNLINQMIFHSSSSLLWVFWEWPATTTDNDLLLNLCKSFTDCPDIILPDESYETQRIYSYLCNSYNNLHHQTDLIISGEDTELALEKAKQFRSCAEKLGKERMDQLQKIHFFKSTASRKKNSPNGDNHGHLILEPEVEYYGILCT